MLLFCCNLLLIVLLCGCQPLSMMVTSAGRAGVKLRQHPHHCVLRHGQPPAAPGHCHPRQQQGQALHRRAVLPAGAHGPPGAPPGSPTAAVVAWLLAPGSGT